jgi:hypothetical protein
MWSIPDGFGGSSGGKTEEKPLLFPIVRQVLAQSLVGADVEAAALARVIKALVRR